MSVKRNLLLLMERPLEPVFMGKGKDNVIFDVPPRLLTDRYMERADMVIPTARGRFGDPDSVQERVAVQDDISLPDLTIPKSLGRHESFSLFIDRHKRIAGALIDIFMRPESLDELQTVVIYARDQLNPLLFNYALSVAILHRPDTKDMNIPLISEIFPGKFIDSSVFRQIREEVNVVPKEKRRPIIIPVDYTASDLEPEHRLWYFREDIGLNLHHWHWHLVYPTDANNDAIVRKDRRGELFYYFHQQMIARYNIERLCNNLPRVKRFNNFREPIQEGYFPKLDSLVAARAWPGRPDKTRLQDLNRELDQLKYDISDLERWRSLFVDACHRGFINDTSGNRIQLDEVSGIDILGDIMESSSISKNRDLYGNLHGMGHVFISYAHDPDHRHLESFGVIGDLATAARDPAFYRWHSYVDDLFQEHKERMPKYTAQQLDYPGIRVTNIEVETDGGPPNVLQTRFQRSDIELSRGLDFAPRGEILVRFTHLQYDAFTYNINIDNLTGNMVYGTCRIFLAPQNDEKGQPFLFRDQRHLMIELDKFTIQLNPGDNLIRRRSTESSLTIPFERTFRNLDKNRPGDGTKELEEFNFCGCGWPQHMLIPKGTTGRGFDCVLFVMVSNYNDDRIDQDLVGTCNDAASFCGIRDRKYPDRRSMGYPFDRLPRDGVDRLEQFLTPNMNTIPCTIVHDDWIDDFEDY